MKRTSSHQRRDPKALESWPHKGNPVPRVARKYGIGKEGQ